MKSGPGETRWHWRTASSATARASNAASASADCRSSVTSTIAVSPWPRRSGERIATRRSMIAGVDQALDPAQAGRGRDVDLGSASAWLDSEASVWSDSRILQIDRVESA